MCPATKRCRSHTRQRTALPWAVATTRQRAACFVFESGVTSQVVQVPVFGDQIVEADETFGVVLSSAVDATIFDGVGIGTIVNDDLVNSNQ